LAACVSFARRQQVFNKQWYLINGGSGSACNLTREDEIEIQSTLEWLGGRGHIKKA
jgi:hypothetical protein